MFSTLEGDSGEREILLKCEMVSVGTSYCYAFNENSELKTRGLAGYPR